MSPGSRSGVVTLCILMSACTSLPRPAGVQGTRTEWPADTPRVRLERIVAARSDLPGWRIGDWLTGRSGDALFERPFGAAWLGGDLLVTDPGAGRVARIGSDGRFVLSPETLFDTPIGIAACGENIVVADSRLGRVAVLSPDLKLDRWLATDLRRPTGVACVRESVFVAETGAHRVLVFRPGLPPETVGGRGDLPGELNFPTALAASGHLLWIGDTLNFRVQGFDVASDRFVTEFGQLGDAPGEMPRGKGIAVDAAGLLWISDANLDQVAIYREDGTFLMSLGRRGVRPGEFSFPAGIAADSDGNVAVVDSLNRRVQIFSILYDRESR